MEACENHNQTTDENDMLVHLQKLLDRLPEMQVRGERLARARAAREAAVVERRYRFTLAELEELDESMEKAAAAVEKARANRCDPAEIELLERDRLYFAAMRGFKVGPVQNDADALEQALTAGGFSSFEEALEAQLSDEEFDSLASEVDTYQKDYADTLALCQKLAGEEY